MDLIIFLPFGLIGHIGPQFANLKILWSIKVTHINKLTDILDQNNINPIIRKMKENKTKKTLQDESKKDDNNQDHIQILYYLLLSYFMRLIKLIILVFVFSYLVGIYWYIFMRYFQKTISNKDLGENFIDFTRFNHVISETTP